ncbi:MAG: SDR family NAD(P)-dependent oxidoreductase, partial [Oscillospiraceae bacterium]|nr:SDR family NAD(P)-dependent oxidoreductase [Oscillospiraceae bacterium]
MRLENQRALVTGGATGIGEAIVRLFAAESASVLVADLNEEKGEALAAELDASSPGRVVFHKTNVASSESYQAAIATTVKVFGGLDVLVNNAGI